MRLATFAARSVFALSAALFGVQASAETAAGSRGIRSEVAFVPAGGAAVTRVGPATLDRRAPPCTSDQNSALPLWPAVPGVVIDTEVGVIVGRAGLRVVTVRSIGDTVICVDSFFATWEDFWSNKESQDLVMASAIAGRTKDAGFAEGSSAGAARTSVADSFYVVSLAKSRFNEDRALLIAAARSVPNPANLVWKLFRIQLTKITNGTHFCTPAADATVFATILGMSGTRLFIAFDSSEDFSVTTGSVLSIDARSLLSGGPAKMKCFTGPQLIDVVPPDVRDDATNAYLLAAPIFSNKIRRLRLRMFPNVANDTVTALADINVPAYGIPPAATQPNGFLLDAGSSEFRVPSIQAGNFLWNVHTIDGGNGHPKVRLYKFSAGGANPLMTLTLSTLANQTDDLIAPSVTVEPPALGNEAFVTFTRTIGTSAIAGRATLMMARGPHSSAAGWTSSVLLRSPGQYSKNFLGGPCDSFIGCSYGPNSSTVLDRENGRVWGFGQIITTDTIGGAGSEKNWSIKGVAVAN
jgi:hypothetical protein